MGPWTYYSPLWLGALLVLALNDSLRALMIWPEWLEWLAVAGVAILAGVQAQVLMIGAQGLFAQVLPVPIGKSIRGGPAVLAGTLLIGWVLLSAAAVLLGLEEIALPAKSVGVAALVLLAAALAVYVWSLPAAVADFRSGRRAGRRAAPLEA
jgi:hypothetical protein